MNKAEHVANEIVRALKMENRMPLDPEDALFVARVAISTLERIHENNVRMAFARWEKLNSEHRVRRKKWLNTTGDMPHFRNMASQPLPDYVSAAIREDMDQLSAEPDRR
jgi:hypothetical protein